MQIYDIDFFVIAEISEIAEIELKYVIKKSSNQFWQLSKISILKQVKYIYLLQKAPQQVAW